MVSFDKVFLAIFIATLFACESESARILGLFPYQGKSHFVMCKSLMRGLAARGHQVDVVGHFPLKNPPPNYRDISLTGTIPFLVNNLTLNKAQDFNTISLEKSFKIGGVSICELLDNRKIRNIIDNSPKDPPYDLVIHELFFSDCYLAFARHLKIPMVGIVTSKLYDWTNILLGNPLNPAFVPSIHSDLQQRMSFVERLKNTFISGLMYAQHSYYVSAHLSFVEKYFGIKISSIGELYNDISIMLVNTHPSYDFVRPLVPGIVEVGGLHVIDGDQKISPDVKKWLNDSKDGCIYMSFGSMVKIETFPLEILKAMYAAFESIAPVRILMKIVKKEELPAGLPKNVMTSPWLPQTRVLQHKNVKAFVTHGGLMSTQEALTYGVPMINIPLFGDQYLNAHLSDKKQISITIDYSKITKESFTKDLKEILENSIYRENMKKVSKLWTDRPMSALDTAIFWIEFVMRNGNVLRSPADHLTWWQVQLLDVYCFIALVLLLSLYGILQLIRCVLQIMPTIRKHSRTSDYQKIKKE